MLVIGGLLAAAIAFVAYQLHVASCPSLGQGYCLPTDATGRLAEALIRFNLYQYGLVVLPALAGAFIGCPLVAGEIENGTHRLAWTQGVTRARWFCIELVLVFVPALVIAGIVGVLEIVLVDQMGADANHWAVFDQHAPMTAASTLFAMSLGVAVGAVMGRSLPAMAVTLVAFVVVRIGLAELARPNFIAPIAYKATTASGFDNTAIPGAWWVDQPAGYDSAGHLVSNAPVFGPNVAYLLQHYQPADRFWTFQAIESGILIALAALLIGFAFYWVTRRVS